MNIFKIVQFFLSWFCFSRTAKLFFEIISHFPTTNPDCLDTVLLRRRKKNENHSPKPSPHFNAHHIQPQRRSHPKTGSRSDWNYFAMKIITMIRNADVPTLGEVNSFGQDSLVRIVDLTRWFSKGSHTKTIDLIRIKNMWNILRTF